MVKSADKPGSVVDSHSSGMHVAVHLERPTRKQCGPHLCFPIWPCSQWGLPCQRCCQRRGALLPHHFTLTGNARALLRRYIFCGTFRRLTPPRRYLAPRPMEPGLSSGRNSLPATVWPTSAPVSALDRSKAMQSEPFESLCRINDLNFFTLAFSYFEARTSIEGTSQYIQSWNIFVIIRSPHESE